MRVTKSVRAIAATVFRRSTAPLAALALLGTVGINSASADVTYTGASVPYGDAISITAPHTISGRAGEITLSGTNTPGSTLLAWCLDIYDVLKSADDYTVNPNGLINGAVNTQIGGLMAYGDKLIKNNTQLVVDNITWDLSDESAAAQIAIWSAEYAGFKYTITTHNGALQTKFQDLVNQIGINAGIAGPSDYVTLVPNCSAGPCPNQTLGYAVPGPAAGAGLPGVAVACAALIALARRRRRALA